MAKYLVLIYGDAQQWANAPAEWHAANADRHQAFIASAGPAVLRVSELEPAERAVSLRANGRGGLSVAEGPFVDYRESIGGYYLLEAADRDEAIRLAGQIPEATAVHGGVEVRRIADPA